jgi:hypothetical protein
MVDDAKEWFKGVLESGSRIRLAPGVIGKSAMMLLANISVWGIVLFRLSSTAPWWFNAMLLLGVSTLTAVVVRETDKMRQYAEANPLAAIFEAADIIAYRRLDAAAKGLSGGDDSPPVEGPARGTMVVATQPNEAQT